MRAVLEATKRLRQRHEAVSIIVVVDVEGRRPRFLVLVGRRLAVEGGDVVGAREVVDREPRDELLLRELLLLGTPTGSPRSRRG